jgi:hypothetical protein
MVPTTGLAPARPFGHSALDAARLLFHHAGEDGTGPRDRTERTKILSRGCLPITSVRRNWCAQRDLHPHTFRYTGLSRARLLFHHERELAPSAGLAPT